MKSVIAAAVLMAAVICGSAVYTSSLITVSEELSEMNRGVQNDLRNGKQESANDGIKQMQEYLEAKDGILSIVGDHNELDKIKINMAEMQEYAKGGTEADALAKSEVLEFLFEHMPENYRLMFKNVL